MKRIAHMMKTSNAMSVRKAACIAGANQVFANPISRRECAWFQCPHVSEEDAQDQFDVRIVNNLSDEVVSAVLRRHISET
jgi:DNA-directed RNA polymerase beta' subunit